MLQLDFLCFRDSIILVMKENLTKKASPDFEYLLKTRTYLKWPDSDLKQQHFWLKLKQSLLVYKPFAFILPSKKRLRLNSL